MKRILFTVIAILTSAACLRGQVVFSSAFEGGAMGGVEKLDSTRFVMYPRDTVECLSYIVHGHFDPLNPVDTTLEPSANWYYFRMDGVKDKQIYLTFPDNGVHRTSYSYDSVHWQHMDAVESPWHKVGKRFSKDTVYIALFNPYTYSYHLQRMAEWEQREDCEIDTIGYSFEGRPLQVLHITDKSVPASMKKLVWIHGRIHPSETPGSWLLDGLVEKLTSDDVESGELRRKIDFYIMPFANPDGVANALSRSNITGVNQEINFGRSDDSTVVEVKAIKKNFERLTEKKPLDLMINNHSQHDDFATFWMHKAEGTSSAYQGKLWTLAGLTCSFNPYIRPTDMSFSSIAPRYAEGWCWNHFGDSTVAVTLETPYNCFSRNIAGEWTSVENLKAFGERFLQAMAEYLCVSTSKRIVVENPQKLPRGWEYLGDDCSHIGECAFKAKKEGAEICYTYKNLPKGEYVVYKYVTGKNIHPERGSFFRGGEDPGIHGWVKVGEHSQKRDGTYKYIYRSTYEGDTADALLLVRK